MDDDSVDEIRAKSLRANRDAFLMMTDWTHQTGDRPLNNKSDWALYRKKLRDLTLRPDYPDIPTYKFPQYPGSTTQEFDRWLYVESPAEGESVWQENPDWVAP